MGNLSTKRVKTLKIERMNEKVNAMKGCNVEGCPNESRTRGYCAMHYARFLRHGDPGGAEKQHSVSNAGKVCEVPQCGVPVVAKGLCMPHYKRNRKWGSPTGGPEKKTPLSILESRFEKKGEDECWIWEGVYMKNGYGKVSVERKQLLAHRLSYRLYVGEIPDGLVIDHLCRVRGCVNPKHLETVTNEENLRRGAGYRLRNGMSNTCINGHEYTPENTYTEPNGESIRCRTCARIRGRKRK